MNKSTENTLEVLYSRTRYSKEIPAPVCALVSLACMTVATSESLPNSNGYQTDLGRSDLLSRFIEQHQELQNYRYVPPSRGCKYSHVSKECLVVSRRVSHSRRNGEPVVLDGQSLTVAGVVGAARYGAFVALNDAPDIRERIAKSRSVLDGKVKANKSVYGVSTGLGGSGAHHTIMPLATPRSTFSIHIR